MRVDFWQHCRKSTPSVGYPQRSWLTLLGLGTYHGQVMQIDEHAPAAVKEALDKKELSINQGYNLTRQLRRCRRNSGSRQLSPLWRLKRPKGRSGRRIRRSTSGAGSPACFVKAFEKAVLLEPNRGECAAWVECTRMNQEELTDTVKEARELAETFSSIADILEQSILPSQGQKEEAV